MRGRCEHLCEAFQAAMDVLSRPWNGLLIATLEEGPLRFSELSERVQGIGDRMLSLRLKELEAQGVLIRTAVTGPPTRVEYALTPAGHGFRPVMAAVASWGAALRAAEPGSAVPPEDEYHAADGPPTNAP